MSCQRLLLILPQPDFGTTAIIAGLCAIMVFMAGLQMKHTAVAGMAGIIIGIPVMIFEPYRVKRLTSFLDPWQSMESEGYHVIQSWVAMHLAASGDKDSATPRPSSTSCPSRGPASSARSLQKSWAWSPSWV